MINRKYIVVTESQPDEMGRVTFKAELKCYAVFTTEGPDFAPVTRRAIVERLCDHIDTLLYEDAKKAARDFYLAISQRTPDYTSYQTFRDQKVKLLNTLKTEGDLPEPIKLPHTQRILEHFTSKDGYKTPDKKVTLPR